MKDHHLSENNASFVCSFKRTINRLFKMIFCYELTTLLVSALVMSSITLEISVLDMDRFFESKEAWLSIVLGTLAGMLVIPFFLSPKEWRKNIIAVHQKMNRLAFIRIFVCFFSIQLIAAFGNGLLEGIANFFGYTMIGTGDSSMRLNAATLLYLAFITPICEELVFRGALLGALNSYGKSFAIVVSSILFGLIHGNFNQGLFAVFAGGILAYVAVEYSLKWSILLHIINNFIFSIGINDVLFIVSLPLFLLAVVIVWKSRITIKSAMNQDKVKQRTIFAFQQGWAVAYVLIHLFMMLGSINKI